MGDTRFAKFVISGLLAVGLVLLQVVWLATGVAAATGSISLSVNEGPVGTTVSVTGSGFTPSENYTLKFAAVNILTGAVDALGSFSTDFQIPSKPRGAYQVTVVTASDNSNIGIFTVTPEITLDTTSGRPGSQVKISGFGFRASATISFLFDDAAAGSVVTNISGAFANVIITVPQVAEEEHTISARDADGASPGVNFSTVEPAISLSQTSGRVGEQVSVSGSGFKPNSSISILFDSGNIGSATANGAGTFSGVKVVIPASSAGKHQITGRDTIGASPGINFSTLSPVFSLSRDSGRVGEQLSVSGSGFSPGSSVSILMDGAVVGSINADGGGTLSNASVIVPAGARGEHIITAKDSVNLSAGVSFKITESTAVNPVTGAVGDTVNITGSGFARKSAITVVFGDTTLKTNIVANDAGTFTGSFKVPEAAAGKHSVRIQDGGSSEAAVSFTVVEHLDISPESGPPGTMVKLTGTGFSAEQPVVIKFNGVPVATSPAVVRTSSRGSFYADFKVPAGLPGIHVVEAGEGSHTATAKYNSILTATISQSTSQAAPGHVGMQLSINGMGFNPDTMVTVTRATIQEPMGKTRTDGQGTFIIDFTLPPSPGGKHTIIVTDGVNKKEFDFYIEQEPPLVPLLLAPENEQKAAKPVAFRWKDVTDQSGVTYYLQIATDEEFDNIILEEEGLSSAELTLADNALKSVTKETPYYWRVKAVDGASNESAWSETRSFSTGFVLTLPNGEREVVLSAWVVYGIFLFAILAVIISFALGRKTSLY